MSQNLRVATWIPVADPDLPTGEVIISQGPASAGEIVPTRFGTGGGPKGDKGDKGDPGTNGTNGTNGAVGATGPQGPKGDQGVQGVQGPKGDQGIPGVSGSGTGDMRGSNNLTDVGDGPTSLINIGGLAKAGGTMTGTLILNADPTTTLAAATKHYVDVQIGATVTKTYVDNANAAQDSVTAAKADKTYVDAADAALQTTKADKTYVDGQTALKADKTYVDSQDLLNVLRNGGTMTANPTVDLGVATKQYVDNNAGKVTISDIPPASPRDGALWWETDSGLLYLYYTDPSGPPGQWVIAAPMPDFSTFANDANVVHKTGDTMTGDLTVSKQRPRLVVDRTTVNSATIDGKLNGVFRWDINLGNNVAESGANVGSDFAITYYNDAGAPVGAAIYINRATGLITVAADPTAALGVATKQYVDAATAVALAPMGMQVNGGTEVNQENPGAVTVSGKYIVDGFGFASGTLPAASISQVTDAPPNFYNSIKATITTPSPSLPSPDGLRIFQNIEGYRIARLGFGTASAQPITIAFWCKVHRAGMYSGSVRNDVTGVANRSYAFTFTMNAVDTWEFKTVTVPGDTTGAWEKTNLLGMRLNFVMGMNATSLTAPNVWTAGSFYGATGMINGIAATTDTFQITGVVVLPGALNLTAAQSSLLMRPYDQELQLCKRYFYKGIPPAKGFVSPGAIQRLSCAHPVTMRSPPVLTLTTNLNLFDGQGNGFLTSVANNYSTTTVFELDGGAGGTGLVAGRYCATYQDGVGNINVDARL